MSGFPAFAELRHVSRTFGEGAAVNDVSLRIQRGEILALLGPSGCGKTTLLRIVAGLEQPSAGQVLLEGRDITEVPPYRRPVNMMFQSYALFPHMTVEQNVGFGLRQEGIDRQEIADRVAALLKLVRMNGFERRRPSQLSGGQQQRVALARSLAKSPKLLLLDEPMAALDRKLRLEMRFELAEIIRRVRVTCVMVTHDQEEAMVMADRLALMHAGKVVQTGSPVEVYESPNSRFSASFLGEVNLLDGSVIEADGPILMVEVPGLHAAIQVRADRQLPGTRVCVVLRPEKLRLSLDDPESGDNVIRTVVEDIGFLGSQTAFQLRVPDGQLLEALVPAAGATSDLQHGQRIYASWNAADAVVLPE